MPTETVTPPSEIVACPQCAAPLAEALTPSEQFPFISALAHCPACDHEWSVMRLLGG